MSPTCSQKTHLCYMNTFSIKLAQMLIKHRSIVYMSALVVNTSVSDLQHDPVFNVEKYFLFFPVIPDE